MSSERDNPKETPRSANRSLWRRWAWRLFRIAVAVYLAVLLLAWSAGDSILFPVPSPHYSADAPDTIFIPSADGGTLPAVWLPNPDAEWTVLYCHANAEDLGTCRPMLDEWRAWGCAVLAIEYPGYGRAPGKPSEEGCYAAVFAGYRHLRTLGVEPTRIAVYGRSLGGVVAVEVARREPVGALLLESTFLSAFRVLTGFRLFPLDRFNSYAKIGDVRCPLLVVHGDADEIVPFWHGKTLFEAAVNAPLKRFLPVRGAGHNDVWRHGGAAYRDAYVSFLLDAERHIQQPRRTRFTGSILFRPR